MKVLFITHNYPRYIGDFSGVFLHTLAKRLRDLGVEVTVAAPHDAGIDEREALEGIDVHRIRYAPDERETFAYRGNMHRQLLTPAGLLCFQRFLRAMRRGVGKIALDGNFDLIAAHWAVPGARVGAYAANVARVPLVVHSHGTDVRLLANASLARLFAGKGLRQACHWTVVSEYLKKLASRAFPALTEKIDICPLPNDESIFFVDETIERNPNLLISVTRFTQQKRVGTLIDACAELRKRNVTFALELYGAGPLRGEVTALIASQGLEKFITLREPVPQAELRSVYNRGAAVILNSLGEGFGLTLVEGALCGALPIGVASGGITDIIQHEVNGLLAPPLSARALADEIERALTDRPLWNRLVSQARADASRKFTGAAVAHRFAELYRSCLKP